jgi:hypothetical protein
MKTFLSGIVGAIAVAVIAAFALSIAQEPAYEVYSSPSVRVGQPGSNLIGPAWSRGSKPGGNAS